MDSSATPNCAQTYRAGLAGLRMTNVLLRQIGYSLCETALGGRCPLAIRPPVPKYRYLGDV